MLNRASFGACCPTSVKGTPANRVVPISTGVRSVGEIQSYEISFDSGTQHPAENVKPDWPQLCSLVLAPLLAGAAGAESVAGVSGFKDVAVEGEAVDDGVDEAGVGDDLAPLAERQI